MSREKFTPKKLKIKKEVAEKWVKALRSSKYRQAVGTLREKNEAPNGKDGFCCLGVLCDLAVQEGAIPEPEYSEESGDYLYGKKTKSAELLPPAVVEWAGLSKVNPQVVDYEGEFGQSYGLTFSDLNDDYGFTFRKIATLIEKAAEL